VTRRAAVPGERAVTGRRAGQIAERVIRGSCRRLPAGTRDERYREWAAEIPAILDDAGTRPAVLRAVRAVVYALGVWKCAHHPLLAAPRQGGSARRAAILRVGRGVTIYLAVIGIFFGLTAAFRLQGPGPLIPIVTLGACFDGLCLADLARAGQVRYLPKWGWALACLVQTPFGGIMYLSAGRVRS
jgi:hypothetical protein